MPVIFSQPHGGWHPFYMATREYKFGTKHQAAALAGLSWETLKKYRRHDKSLVENIHWVKINARTIRYNLPLIVDWVANRHDPAAHQRAIEH